MYVYVGGGGVLILKAGQINKKWKKEGTKMAKTQI
jgi:hypothetical protein